MPAQNGVRRDQRGNFVQQFAAQDLPFDSESSTLVVVEQNPFLAVHFLENLVFRAEVLDDLLLLLVHPASENRQQQLPRLNDEAHGGTDNGGQR